jgi:hypothetical protein
MTRRKLDLGPVAVGLVLANVVLIGVAVASLLVARRAWQLRDAALTAAAQAQAAVAAPRAPARPPAMHAPLRKLRPTTLERMLLLGIAGGAASAFFTWLLVTRSRGLKRLALAMGPSRNAVSARAGQSRHG